MRARRPFIALLLVAAACGADTKGSVATRATPEASAASLAPTGASGASGSDSSTTSVTSASPPTATTASVPAPGASANTVTLAKPGKYIYAVTGSRPDATGKQSKIADGTTSEIEVAPHRQAGAGTIIEFISKEEKGSTTIQTKWFADKAQAIKTSLASPQFTVECNNTPPTTILLIPITAGSTIARQQFKDGDTCEGSYEATVIGAEDITDASGRVWRVWKMTSKATATFGAQSFAIDSVEWFSPQLGTQVRKESVTTGEYKAPQGSVPFRVETNSLLKSHP